MNIVNKIFVEAELALAAYAELNAEISGKDYTDALEQRGEGLTPTQAADFATRWRVIDQYDGKVEETYIDEFGQEHTFLNPTGLNVTLFEEVGTGKQVVAIRGTELTDYQDIVTDLVDIVALGTVEHQQQYSALTNKAQEWIDNNLLHTGFTLTGHSLGGFLATNLTAEYAGQDHSHSQFVTHYQYCRRG